MGKVLLSCSLLANAVFAVLLAADPYAAPDGTGDHAGPSAEPDARRAGAAPASAGAARASSVPRGASSDSGDDRGSGDPAGEYRRLLAAGLAPWEAKTLVRAGLERRAAAGLEPPDDKYWESGAEAHLAHALEALGREDGVRAALREAFGDEARDDPAFASLFRPLDPYFRFLDSGQQLAVRRAQLLRRLELASAERSDAAPSRAGGTPAEPRPAASPRLDAVLDEQTLFEYELRDSRLAHALRAAKLGLDEREFREAFALLRRLERGGGDLDVVLEVRESLRRMLGPRGFAAVWRSRDPAFGSIERVARDRDWTDALVLEIYTAVAEHDERLLAAVAGAPDPGALAERVRELDEALEARLSDLVGAEDARALVRARALESFRSTEGNFAFR